jgi:hypothetical protein
MAAAEKYPYHQDPTDVACRCLFQVIQSLPQNAHTGRLSRCIQAIHSVAYPSSVDITVVQCAQVVTDPVYGEKEEFTTSHAIGENALRYTIPPLSLHDDSIGRMSGFNIAIAAILN